MLKHITDFNEFKEAVSSGLVVADFYTTWCGPCKMLSPLLEELAEEYPQLTVVKVDAEAAPEISAEYRISVVPTLYKFVDGKMVEMRQGYMPKPVLIKFLGL